jgi:hypothetical protein
MIGAALAALLFWAIFGIWAWNLWGAFANGSLYLRFTEYRPEKNKFWFWMAVSMSIVWTLLTLGLALLMTAGLLGLV